MALDLNAVIKNCSQLDSLNALCFSLEVPLDLPYFNGHFPNNPILPAVGLIDILNAVIREYINPKLSILSIKRAKFTSPILPGEVLMFKLDEQERGFKYHWKVSILREEGVVAKMNIACKEID